MGMEWAQVSLELSTFARNFRKIYILNGWQIYGPRNTYPGEPKKKQHKKKTRPIEPPKPHPGTKSASFKNGGKLHENAELYFRDQFWDKFDAGAVLNVNTFEGHEWNVRVNGDIVKEWVMDRRPRQVYEI